MIGHLLVIQEQRPIPDQDTNLICPLDV